MAVSITRRQGNTFPMRILLKLKTEKISINKISKTYTYSTTYQHKKGNREAEFALVITNTPKI